MNGLKPVNLNRYIKLFGRKMPSMSEVVRFFDDLQNNRRTLGITTKRKRPVILSSYDIFKDNKRGRIVIAVRFSSIFDLKHPPIQTEHIIEEIEIGSRNLLRLFSEYFVGIIPKNLEVKKRSTGKQEYDREGLAIKCKAKHISNLDLVLSFPLRPKI